MKNAVLTDIKLRKLKADSTKRTEIWDAKLPGFGVRISPLGTKSFVLMYRFKGKQRRQTLGRYPIMSLAEARKEAQAILYKSGMGEDPAPLKTNETKPGSFAQVMQDFLIMHCERENKPSTVRSTKQLLAREFLPHWKDSHIQEIEKKDVLTILDALVARGVPGTANHAYAAIRKFFAWCNERDLVDQNPCADIKRPAKIKTRDRVLSYDELTRIWHTVAEQGYPFCPIVRLLMLTGQRRGEVANMHWAHVDLEARVWELPKEMTKSHRAHIVPLSETCCTIIEGIPKIHETFLFPAAGSDTTTFSGFGKCKRRLDMASGVSDWTLHDLRRTAATGMAQMGIAPHIVEKVLNHATGTFSGVAGVYNRFGYVDEMREALTKWDAKIKAQIISRPS